MGTSNWTTYIERPEKKVANKPSWWTKIWSSVKGWFTTDDEKVENKKTNKPKEDTNSVEDESWWESTWSSIKNIL